MVKNNDSLMFKGYLTELNVTYQDLSMIPPERELDRLKFIQSAIFQHKSTDMYKYAIIAGDYARKQNTTIVEFQKFLYSLDGNAIPDTFSANYKLCSGFFKRFITQENQFLFGNGTTWNNDDTAEKLGKDFDYKLQKAGRSALIEGVSFGFFNNDHIEVFKLTEFVPLVEEDTGALSAGIRFWQISETKPMRATLYELDGFTEYIWGERDSAGRANTTGRILRPKQPYKVVVQSSEAEGTQIVEWQNYPTFPIVPFFGNEDRQSELVGLREQIDAYDLIKSGFCNTVDDASIIYWLISGAGGMDDFDLNEFINRIRRVHAAAPQDGQTVTAQAIEPPYQSRDTLLALLKEDLYRDAMAFDPQSIVSGSTVQAQIKAAYEPLNEKTDEYDHQAVEFVGGILALAGIDDEPTFTRSMLVNASEEVTTVLQAAAHLDEEYVVKKILTILGDADQFEDVMKRKDQDDLDRMRMGIGQALDRNRRTEQEAENEDGEING